MQYSGDNCLTQVRRWEGQKRPKITHNTKIGSFLAHMYI